MAESTTLPDDEASLKTVLVELLREVRCEGWQGFTCNHICLFKAV